MRFLLLTLGLLGFAGIAHAEDDFGQRFTDQVPAALQEEVTDEAAAAAVQAVEPAAGEEQQQQPAAAEAPQVIEPAAGEAVDASADNPQSAPAAQETPEAPAAEAEKPAFPDIPVYENE